MKRFRYLLSSVFYIFIILLSLIFTEHWVETAIKGRSSFFGYSSVRVLSKSMEASGIYVNDVYFIVECNEYNVGDVVVFNHGTDLWFHEIVFYDKINDIIQTKGSSNPCNDGFTISAHNIIGKSTGIGCNYGVYMTIVVSIMLILYVYLMSIIIKAMFYTIKQNQTKSARLAHSGTRHHVRLPIVLLSGFGVLGSSVYCASSQAVMMHGDVSYIPPITYSSVIEGLRYLSVTPNSYVYNYFHGKNIQGNGKENLKPIGSSLDSTGYNWAPYVNSELAEYLNITLDTITSIHWIIIRGFTGYSCYHTNAILADYPTGTAVKTYAYLSLFDEYSYSTCNTTIKKVEHKNVLTLDIYSYDIMNRVVL